MYIVVAMVPACLLGWLFWKLLGRTGLSRALRVALTLVGAALIASFVFWGGIYLSILMFQWNDPITW